MLSMIQLDNCLYKGSEIVNINLVCPLIVLDNEENTNIRKNDLKKLKMLVDSNENLIKAEVAREATLKEVIRNKISRIIDSNNFHLEQVYTLGEEKYYFDKSIDILYLAVTNIENIKKLNENYKLVDFHINDNVISFGNNNYKFKTKERILNNNIEYYHEIKADKLELEKELLEILIVYKLLRSKLDNSDLIFKFMPKYFTLEDVRIVYEMLKEVSVDKSNFRKKIVKYCVETDAGISKKGYRPSKTYTFKVMKGDIWL